MEDRGGLDVQGDVNAELGSDQALDPDPDFDPDSDSDPDDTSSVKDFGTEWNKAFQRTQEIWEEFSQIFEANAGDYTHEQQILLDLLSNIALLLSRKEQLHLIRKDKNLRRSLSELAPKFFTLLSALDLRLLPNLG